jgi:hypothetical protein
VLAALLVGTALLARSNLQDRQLVPAPGPPGAKLAECGGRLPGSSPSLPGTHDRKVFAHYFPPYPISLDNKPPRATDLSKADYYTRNYLTVNGENDKHAVYGGLLRDRPIPRPPVAGAAWRLADLRTEVKEAKAAGLDGFTLNLLTIDGQNWDWSVLMMKAAQQVGGFEVVPNLDASASFATHSPAEVADKLAELYGYRSAAREAGAYLLSSFKAENKSPSWWAEVISLLKSDHDVPVKLIAVFLDASDANMEAYRKVAYAYGIWGVRTVASVRDAPDYAAKAHALGKKWMAPVAPQDERPREQNYAEASNTGLLRAMWARADADRADYVQIVTWNDYSESTQIAPSVAHGCVFLDLMAYYAARFVRGSAPEITTDRLYLTHRIQPSDAVPVRGNPTAAYTMGGMNTPPKNNVEGLAFLTAPATLSLTSGGVTTTFALKAGISAVTVPLRTGTVSARLSRGSRTLQSLTSPFQVTRAPEVLDFQYFAVGSPRVMRYQSFPLRW